MLQRAASNAYSWWWASHVRTKQSKWLEQELQDMEEKVSIALRIIDHGGDSFAQRAEMYYRKRPEIICFVEESFRAYRALAERYDHLSRELQSANRTIATAFPERVQYAMDMDDHEENCQLSQDSSSIMTEQSIPKVPKLPSKDQLRSPSNMGLASRKGLSLRNIPASITESSGLTKTEALDEIDRLQKDILGLQTEQEFVKSMYEHGYQKFWDIENQVTEMHRRVSNLQDEFGIGTVIADDEARALMAATALKSCEETLEKLREKKDQSAEEAKAEQRRIMEAQEKFESLRARFEPRGAAPKSFDDALMESAEVDVAILREKIKEQFDVKSESSLTVTELAEKIDELVSKVVSLESKVSSQTVLVKQMGSETDKLQENVRSLEEDKEILKEGSENMKKKMKELEEELARVKDLNRSFRTKNNDLQTDFTEASCSLDHLSNKLQSVKQDEEETGDFEAKSEEENTVETVTIDDDNVVEEEKRESQPIITENVAESDEKIQSSTSGEAGETEAEKEERSNKPSLRQLFMKGLEDREKILLEEYTSVLQDYKEVKKKLGEVENKNRDSIFELAMQIRELKSNVAAKDDEIKTLKQHNNNPSETMPGFSPESIVPSQNLGRESVSDISDANPETLKKLIENEDAVRMVSSIEEKFRSDIDGLLEENLEFWLRFSTSVHQIQKFETSIEDLHLELQKLREHKNNSNKKSDSIGALKQHSIQSDARPIYRHLREIQTEMSLWLEHNAVLKDELQGRFLSLCHIQKEIGKAELSGYQAAKFQGEVLNMKQENNKVADEIRIGLGRVRALKREVESTLVRLNDELGISAKRESSPAPTHNHRPRIPLRSFLFGVKLKRQKPSIFSCVSPALQKQYSDLEAVKPLSSG